MKSLIKFIAEALTKFEVPFEKIYKNNNIDPSKTTYVVTRNTETKEMHVFTIYNQKDLEQFIDSLRDGKSEHGYYQTCSNDIDRIKDYLKLSTWKQYKKTWETVNESCDDHVICQDAAGNWRIKGTPGKGTNTEKMGFWKAKYKTKEDAEAALRGYFANK